MKLLKAKFSDMRALLIIYELSKEGKIVEDLRKFDEKEAWFNFTILKQNDELITKVLANNLRPR
jgi:hypothetical protein